MHSARPPEAFQSNSERLPQLAAANVRNVNCGRGCRTAVSRPPYSHAADARPCGELPRLRGAGPFRESKEIPGPRRNLPTPGQEYRRAAVRLGLRSRYPQWLRDQPPGKSNSTVATASKTCGHHRNAPADWQVNAPIGATVRLPNAHRNTDSANSSDARATSPAESTMGRIRTASRQAGGITRRRLAVPTKGGVSVPAFGTCANLDQLVAGPNIEMQRLRR